jgi:hypothetical protein
MPILTSFPKVMNMGDKKNKGSAASANTADPAAAANTVNIERQPGKSDEQLMTELAMSPLVRNTLCSKSYATPAFSGSPPQFQAALEFLKVIASEVRGGNLDRLTDMLVAQALTLDCMFTEYSRRSLLNAGEYIGAAQSYATMALKAQTNCRTTVEALAKTKRGATQTVKVVHIHQGAQAVVADTFNQGGARAKKIKQPHAKAADAPVAALQSQNEAEQGVPIPGNEERQVSHARRDEPRRANR